MVNTRSDKEIEKKNSRLISKDKGEDKEASNKNLKISNIENSNLNNEKKFSNNNDKKDNDNKNIIWHKSTIGFKERCQNLEQIGQVLWFTGLSGSGKSTIAVEVESMLIKQGKVVYRLDGDNIRHGLNNDLSFSAEDRKENIRRIAEVASLFKDAGIITLVSFISPYRESREFARNCIGEEYFKEIYIKADIDSCIERDPKDLYKKALAGEINNFTGVSAPYEVPESPDLVIDTNILSVEESARSILGVLIDDE